MTSRAVRGESRGVGGRVRSLLSRVGTSLRESASRVEALEQRVMMSGDLPAGASAVPWGSGRVAAVTNSYLIGFDDMMGVENARLIVGDVARALGVSVSNVEGIGRGYYATFSTPAGITKDQARAVSELVPGVKGIAPNKVYQTLRAPNDPQYQNQYGLENTGQNFGAGPGVVGADIGAEQAWDITIGSRDVIVGVIDSGFDMTHPDLVANYWRNPGEVAGNGVDDDGNGFVDDVSGYDFGNLDSDPTESTLFDDPLNEGELYSHGTGVAGVIGAVGNNGIGITGVAWNISLLPLKISDDFGRLTLGAIVGAHDYVTMMRGRGVNVAVTNNSYGTFQLAPDFYDDDETDFDPEREAIERYIASGGVFVASAGNSSNDNDEQFTSFPAAYGVPGVIAVAATDAQDNLADFSSYGVRTTDLASAGVSVLTTAFGGGYSLQNGTSFSGPMVAGAVALLKSFKPNASAVEIREALINSSDPVPALQNRVRSGGRVNVARALEIIGSEGPNLRSLNPGPVTTQIDSSTGQPLRQLRLEFSEDLDTNAGFFNTSAVTVTGDGADNVFGTVDDISIPVQSLALESGSQRRVVVTLNTTALPVDTYQVRALASGFRDLAGNRLLGNTSSGRDEVRTLRVVGAGGDNESNDTLATATPVNFGSSGEARFENITLGNGLAGALDVDLYRIDVPQGGQITAEITAQRLATPSSFDSYLRLFDASGQEVANNDQFFLQDSFISTFVRTGGTYYIGVSGLGNDDYNPRLVSSGTSQSTGLYSLRISTQLSQDDVVVFDSAGFSQVGQPALPINIPRGGEPNPPVLTQGTASAAISVPDTRQILDVNVRLNIQHTAIGDLQISLIAPDGTTVLLSNNRGGDADGYGTINTAGQVTGSTTFDDEATVAITAGAAPYVGSFRSEQSLGAFDGLDGDGLWTLRIVDTKPTDSGRLLDWGLTFKFQNDIFGRFESNDTLTTASDITDAINGIGTFEGTPFLGDGGFGSFDRDIFRFVAEPGSSLTATVSSVLPSQSNPSPVLNLNSAMRLFDGSGAPILLASPGTSLESTITNYIIPTGGTYYLAVSEGANIAYDPTVANSGNASITTGEYRLRINVAKGVSDGPVAKSNGRFSTGVDSSGLLLSPDGRNLFLDGVEFLANEQTFLGAAANGVGFANGSGSSVPFSIVDQSDPFNTRVVTRANFDGLRIDRAISFGAGNTFAVVDVKLTNITAGVKRGVAWMEGYNPDPGVSVGEATRATLNDITPSGKQAISRYFNNTFEQGLTFALAAPSDDTRAKATFIPSTTVVRDAAVLAAQPANDPQGVFEDQQAVLVYSLGDLVGGASATMRYFVLLGTTPVDVQNLLTAIDTGTGTGHLSKVSSQPGTETISTGESVPTLPFRTYYPEGFLGPNIFTFLPISNPNDADARVVVIQHFELNNGQPASQRDRIVADIVVPGRARRGVDVNTPALFESTLRNLPVVAGSPGGNGLPYALEIRSDVPVSATFSYYDLVQISSGPVAVGESFTPVVSESWSFGEVEKIGSFGSAGAVNSYVIFYNPGIETAKITVRFFRQTSGDTPEVYRITRDVPAGARSGVYLSDAGFDLESTIIEENNLSLPDGTYGVSISSDNPVVAAKSTYDPSRRRASGTIANDGLGSTSGVLAEGQFGLRASDETVGILNANGAAASVTLSYVFGNGSTIRRLVTVPANRHASVSVRDVPNFITGQAYSVSYTSDLPVSVTVTSPITDPSTGFQDAFSVTSAQRGYTAWGFGEGFRPGDNSDWSDAAGRQAHPGVIENLRLFNPSNDPITVEIVFNFDLEPGQEVFRRTLPARTVSEFNIDEFINASRRVNNQSYGIFIKAPVPIVAEMNHVDRLFPGAFATLGTPMGQSGVIG